jgi:hypothetical protein
MCLIQVQQDAHCIFYFFFTNLDLPVSGAICAHHQENSGSVQRFSMVWCVIPLEQVVVWDSDTLELYAAVVLLMMGTNRTRNL